VLASVLASVFGATDPLVKWGWVNDNRGLIESALGHHIELTLIAVAVGFVISMPLAVVAWKVRALRPVFVTSSGLLYVIPSVALFVLLQPITGFFSIATAEVALVSYTLLILVRNTLAGLDAVPAEVREAARGMGYGALRELVRVDLPLALPSVFAGLRVATVTVIGLVTVTAFIGQGGLGQLIIQGFSQSGFHTPIVVGLVLSVVLAGVADALLVVLERLTLPWVRRGQAA
jgi:osmoprotectant transport system permease protein